MFSHRISRRGLVLGAAALVLGSAAAGAASSQQAATVAAQTGNQQDGPKQQRHQQYLEALAKNLGIDAERLKQAMEAARKDVGLPERGASGPGFRGGPNAAALAERHQKLLETVANKLSVDVDDLKQAMADARPKRGENNGQRPNREQILADIASRLNVSTEDLTKAFQEARQELGFPQHRPGGPGFRRGPQPND